MSNEKNTTDRTPAEAAKADLAHDADAHVESKPIVKPKVVALAIDEDFESGGDPYNHTGSHYVAKIRDLS